MKKEPIIFMLPMEYKDREYQVAFDKHIEDINSVFVLDLDKIKMKPMTGTEAMMSLPTGYKIYPKAIKKKV